MGRRKTVQPITHNNNNQKKKKENLCMKIKKKRKTNCLKIFITPINVSQKNKHIIHKQKM